MNKINRLKLEILILRAIVLAQAPVGGRGDAENLVRAAYDSAKSAMPDEPDAKAEGK